MERHKEGIDRIELESLAKALESNRSPQFLKGIALSLRQGGTMLKVLPLAERGKGPTEISRILQISVQSVASSEIHLRRWGLIPESRVQRTKRLLAELSHLPDSFEARQSIVDSISFRLYRDNPDYFVTFTRLLRDSGRSKMFVNIRLADFLKCNQIANRLFWLSINKSYGIILAAENQKSQELLREFPYKVTNPS